MDSITNKPSIIDPRPISEQGNLVRSETEGSLAGSQADQKLGDKRLGMERLSRTQEANLEKSDSIKATEETKALDIFSSLFNSGKKALKLACLLGGFISASGAVIFTFAFNVKTLGVVFGIPALLFFYTATTLGASIKQDPGAVTDKDPVGSLKKITEEHPEYLRENKEFVLRTIKAVANMRKQGPLYSQALDRLASLEEAIKMEQVQLAGLDDERSLMHQSDMTDYLRAIENIFEEEGATVMKPSIYQDKTIADLHRNNKSLTNAQVA